MAAALAAALAVALLGPPLPPPALADVPPLALAGASATAALLGVGLWQRPRLGNTIYVRPGQGAYGVGLIAIRRVPRGARICTCDAKYSRFVRKGAFRLLHPSVQRLCNELFDGTDADGGKQCLVPTEYDQAIPLISFINHSPRPNCRYEPVTNAIFTTRGLRPGEEATVDYTKYQEPGSYTYQEAVSGFK